MGHLISHTDTTLPEEVKKSIEIASEYIIDITKHAINLHKNDFRDELISIAITAMENKKKQHAQELQKAREEERETMRKEAMKSILQGFNNLSQKDSI